MRKSFFLSLFIFPIVLLSVVPAYPQGTEKYSRVKVYPDKTQMKSLHPKGIAFDEMAEKNDKYFIGDFSAREIAFMKQDKLRIEVITDNLTQDFLKRNKEASVSANDAMRTGGTPPGFSYG